MSGDKETGVTIMQIRPKQCVPHIHGAFGKNTFFFVDESSTIECTHQRGDQGSML
jgi:hypothetical protein